MEPPVEVLVHNELLGLKGREATLLAVSPHGYYEVATDFGDRPHRVLLPIVATVLIARDPEEEWEPGVEIER
jgi:hypothetical protein